MYFYSLGDSVMCIGRSSNSVEEVSIPLPAKIIIAGSTRVIEISTDPWTDPYDMAKWTPKIPSYSQLNYKNQAWSFSACCLKYDEPRPSCGHMINFEVIGMYG